MEEKIKEIYQHIENADLGDALALGKEVFKNHAGYTQIITMISSFNLLKKQQLAGAINIDKLNENHNAISLNLLNLIQDAQKQKGNDALLTDKEVLSTILDLLKNAWDGFLNQAEIRDELRKAITARSDELQFEPQYWKYFIHHYDKGLTPVENVLHIRIRGYTKDIIGKYNFQILDILESSPHLYDLVPELRDLHDHLEHWKSCYDNEFLAIDGMSLVYLIEQNKGFPRGIEQKIKECIAKM